MASAIQPSPHTWILRFKHNRTTIFLHVDPLQKLTSVRAELLKAVQQSCPDGTLNGRAIPEHGSDVLLARPADINDVSLGWEPLDKHDELDEVLVEDKKGKGKATAGASAKASKEKITDCPQGVGLRDGGVVAFRFRSEADAVAREKDEGIDVEGVDKLDGETLVGKVAPEQWDVVVPKMEELYGEETANAGLES